MAARGNRGGSDVWYDAGLRFGCTGCRQCCTGEPGYVWVTKVEIGRLADFLDIPLEEFTRTYCRRVFLSISLRERPNGDCVLLGPSGCLAYPARPSQCRTFPFWKSNLGSRRRWDAVKRRCPGLNRGRLYSRDEIEHIMRDEADTQPGPASSEGTDA
jgi:Fe-S-cluster containining protein